MNDRQMAPARWEQVKTVLQTALEYEPDRRADYLAAACADDPALRAEVESLIAYQAGASGFIEAPAFAQAGAQLLDAASASTLIGADPEAPTLMGSASEAELGRRAGQQIGPYRVMRELGQGGMGAVYLAERADDEYRKQVAIKLIKRGMDSEFVLRRFRNERQILAALDHPNIARLHDGGTTEDGLPYLVMEYIEGTPLDLYCEQHELTTAERLRLFRQVCSAVHYAHQRLVIHRDLKPSNILVTSSNEEKGGTPKLLDFGIAKLLTAELAAETLDQTQAGLRLMTPAYASPEQVRGELITTASDVFALGVVLYELLTGHSPYRLRERTQQEILQAVCEQEPERPSAVTEERMKDEGGGMKTKAGHTSSFILHPSSLRGDLDNILLMALRKEPQRRYASVEQFSEDLRRHLEGLPVIARKDTLGYRASKFIQRNKLGVTAAALLLLTLLAGVVATLWQARVAQVERARAERRFNDVRKLANLFMFDYHDAIAVLPGSTLLRQRLVKDALEYLDSLAKETGADRSLQRELATAYLKIGDVQGGIVTAASGETIAAANLGDTAGALTSYRKAGAIYEGLAVLEPARVEVREGLGKSYARLGDLNLTLGKPAGAFEYAKKAIAIYEELSAADPTNKVLRKKLSSLYALMANALYTPSGAHLGDLQGALGQQRKSLAIDEWLARAEPAKAESRQILAADYGNIGSLLSLNGSHAEALDHQQKAAAISAGLVSEFDTNPLYRRELAVQYGNAGRTLLVLGDKTSALEKFRQSVAILEALVAADPNNAEARRLSATGYRNLAEGLAALREQAQALKNFNRALQILDELRAKDPQSARLKLQQSLTYLKLSACLSEAGDVAGASQKAQQARELSQALLVANSSNSSARNTLALSCAQLGKAYTFLAAKAGLSAQQQKAHWQEARDCYQQSFALWQESKAKGTLNGADAGKLDESARELARCDAALAKSR